jgi:hypothetical protein
MRTSIFVLFTTLLAAQTEIPRETAERIERSSRQRTSCTPNGTVGVVLTRELEEGTESLGIIDPQKRMMRELDLRELPGFSNAELQNFSLHPNGNIYVVLQRKQSERFHRNAVGKVTGSSADLEEEQWLLVLTPKGDVSSQAVLKDHLNINSFGVFSNGDIIAVGSRNSDDRGFAGILSPQGELRKYLEVPGLDSDVGVGKQWAYAVVQVGADDRGYIRLSMVKPETFVFSASGEKLSRTTFAISAEVLHREFWHNEQFLADRMAAIKKTGSGGDALVVTDLEGNSVREVTLARGNKQFLDTQLVCFVPGQFGLLSVMQDQAILDFVPEAATEYSPFRK